MSDGAAFPGQMDREVWKEYRAICMKAESWEATAHDTVDKNPRGAQVAANMAVASRLEQLAYLIARMAAY